MTDPFGGWSNGGSIWHHGMHGSPQIGYKKGSTQMSNKKALSGILLTGLWAGLIFVLAVGALILSSLVGKYTYDSTGDVVLARVIGSIVFGGFAFSLGVVIGVGNYLRSLRVQEKTLSRPEKDERGSSEASEGF